MKTNWVWSDSPEIVKFAEHLSILDVAAHVSPQWCVTYTAWEAAHMPAKVVHLRQEKKKDLNKHSLQLPFHTSLNSSLILTILLKAVEVSQILTMH